MDGEFDMSLRYLTAGESHGPALTAILEGLPAGLAVVSLNPGIINTDMLKQVWGKGAERFPTPERWARCAVDLLLGLSAADNGKQLSVSG